MTIVKRYQFITTSQKTHEKKKTRFRAVRKSGGKRYVNKRRSKIFCHFIQWRRAWNSIPVDN